MCAVYSGTRLCFSRVNQLSASSNVLDKLNINVYMQEEEQWSIGFETELTFSNEKCEQSTEWYHCFIAVVNSLRPSDLYMHHWFRSWLVDCSAPSHYLNQCSNIVNWTFRNKIQWNFNRNSYIFIQENAFENVVCETAIISSRPQWVNINIIIIIVITIAWYDKTFCLLYAINCA